MNPLPFNRVVLTEGGTRQELSAERFVALPLDRKIKYILSRSVEFFNGTTAVDRKTALAHLRDWSTA